MSHTSFSLCGKSGVILSAQRGVIVAIQGAKCLTEYGPQLRLDNRNKLRIIIIKISIQWGNLSGKKCGK